MVIKLKDAKIRINDGEHAITGKYTGGINVAHIDGIGECENTHLLRVLNGTTDPNIESEYITLTSQYDVVYGTKTDGKYSTLTTDSVNLYRGDLEVNVSTKVITSKQAKATKKYIKLYPNAVLLPDDFADHIETVWDVFEE